MEGRLVRGGLLRFERQDVCALPYGDGTFDAVTAISMLEHVPDQGDSMAVREMARVLKPGGRLILTTPFTAGEFDPGRPPYSSSTTQRVYNDQAITTRLIAPSALDVTARLHFSNRWLDFEKWWRRIPQVLINGIGWTGLALVSSRLFFAPTLRPGAMGARAVCVVLVK
jgi:ubiquinone/menaquinone biosynthesis C-methylase UbiE